MQTARCAVRTGPFDMWAVHSSCLIQAPWRSCRPYLVALSGSLDPRAAQKIDSFMYFLGFALKSAVSESMRATSIVTWL